MHLRWETSEAAVRPRHGTATRADTTECLLVTHECRSPGCHALGRILLRIRKTCQHLFAHVANIATCDAMQQTGELGEVDEFMNEAHGGIDEFPGHALAIA